MRTVATQLLYIICYTFPTLLVVKNAATPTQFVVHYLLHFDYTFGNQKSGLLLHNC
jgi:hypothetical protein